MLRLASARLAVALWLITAGSAGVPAAELTFDIKIVQDRIPDTKRLMRVHQGDIVKLRWTSDRPLILHLHAYDIEERVAPGAVTEFAFTADATGRFPIQIHKPGTGAGAHAHAGVPLAIIEVHPR